MADTLRSRRSALMGVSVQVRVGLQMAMGIWYGNLMKNKSRQYRNPSAIPAKARNCSGPMRDKRTKRLNGKNKQLTYLEDNY